MATTRYEGNVSSASNEFLPLAVRENGRFSTRDVINPTGLPAGTYLIAEWITDPQVATGAVQIATDTAGVAWMRRSTAFPSTWTAWVMLGGGGAGVLSFNGRVGVVLPAAGDYNTTQITNASGVAGATATAALNTLNANKIDKPAPVLTDDVLVYDGVNWVASSVHTTGDIPILRTGTLQEEVANTPINGAVGLALTGTGVQNAYLFRNQMALAGINSFMFEVRDDEFAFNDPTAAVFAVTAPNSLTLGGGTRFIACFNNQAVAAPYTNNIVFGVDSNGTARALAFTIWSSAAYKKDITALNCDSTALRDIHPATYRYMSETNAVPKRAGLMWEDIYPFCPEACPMDGNNKTLDAAGIQGLTYALMKSLESRITALEGEVGMLRARVLTPGGPLQV